LTPRFPDLCGFCLEEHRGVCGHPECPIAFTGGLGDDGPRRRPAPTPTRPSVAGGAPARPVAPPPAPGRAAPPHIATRPSVADDPRGER